MADKTTTSLTSHSLFPASSEGLGFSEFSPSFSFAPTLVPTTTTPPQVEIEPQNNTNVDIPLNTEVLEGEIEKFVGQPVTPPRTPGRADMSSFQTPGQTDLSSSSSQPQSTLSSYSSFTSPTTPESSELPYNIYSPMSFPPQQNLPGPPSGPYMQPTSPTGNTTNPNFVSSKPIHAVPPFSQSQQPLYMSSSGTASPYQPAAPPSTPEIRQKASPVRPHWFYLKNGRIWTPFSWKDSGILHQAFSEQPRGVERIVATDGGRYDVNIDQRTRHSVYWSEPVTVVRPCTWFCKAHDGENKLVPYEESVADKLEQAFLLAHDEQKWPKTVNLERGETVIMHNSNVMVHFSADTSQDEEWSGEDIRSRPKVVRRGIDDFEAEIDDGEPSQIDHLVFVVHGIGPYADLKFRSLIECVNDFRKVSLEMMDGRREKLTGNHDNLVGRIEFLPVLWHSAVHDDMPTGVDRRLQSITINSVTKLREFTNSTLLDILFFTSPVYCQTIVDKVGSEMNRLLKVFQQRNPGFNGSTSVCGHSLGSAILFDILQHQGDEELIQVGKQCSAPTPAPVDSNSTKETPAPPPQSTIVEEDTGPSLEEILKHLGLDNFCLTFQMEQIDGEALMMCSEDDLKELSIPMGPRKKILSYQKEYPKIKAERQMSNQAVSKAPQTTDHMTSQQEQTLSNATDLSTPHSSITNLSPNPSTVETVEIIQYHHGVQGTAGTGQPYVRYPKLNFQPCNMFALGSPIGLFLTVRGVENIGNDYRFPTCPGFYNIFHPYDPVAYRLEPLVVDGFNRDPILMQHHKGRKRMHLELRENLSRLGANLKQRLMESMKETWATINDFARAHTAGVSSPDGDTSQKDISDTESQSDIDEKHDVEETVPVGCLNRGQRLDYVLQEKPIEILNEYLFALSSHVCYWQSEDTALFMLKEIYKS